MGAGVKFFIYLKSQSKTNLNAQMKLLVEIVTNML